MQVVRNAGSLLLRSWFWPPPTRVVAGVPAPTIHTCAQQMQDAAAKQEVEEKAEAPAPSRSRFRNGFSGPSQKSEVASTHQNHVILLFGQRGQPLVWGQESSLRWAGKKFEEIPIAHIKASYNNTQIQVVSAAHQPLAHASCGTEGFRNAKKGTGIAAQTAAIAAAAKATRKGVTHVRVVVKGLGPGRLSAIKGLTMGGLEVISITDNTPIPHNGCRPRKARRL
ncbi:28S ribosomal protein S11, mitochondrial isoform X1 [Hippopotamus amphibius kiboko]|uniref:28S ribosomal protein S11, mitochondrial isoform X1 n=1 Tax=Hippopotamus amphibius kiboko TaxID=575201 RepID=UPI002594EA4C|nr:28S ribosomal protein S11, mitochondrial isoform X1 [Hippopotamus amphibius kiboko]